MAADRVQIHVFELEQHIQRAGLGMDDLLACLVVAIGASPTVMLSAKLRG